MDKGLKYMIKGFEKSKSLDFYWLRGLDLNQRPLGYEPNELPDCSTPRLIESVVTYYNIIKILSTHFLNHFSNKCI